MSHVTAFTLQDGSLLISDSRITAPLNSLEPQIDDVDKIHKISDEIFMCPLGVTQITDAAINRIKAKNINFNDIDLDNLIRNISTELFNSMAFFESILDPNVDRNEPWMMGALMVCGILNKTPFILEIKCSFKDGPSIRYETKPWKGFPLGGPQDILHKNIFENASNIMKTTEWEEKVGPINNRINGLIDSVAKGIKTITPCDDIGGAIRYVVIRNKFGSCKGIWAR
jgi:hypothetical protein